MMPFELADGRVPAASLCEEIVEIPLLLPGWQAEALETAAHDQGLTTGQMVRRLIRSFCEQRHQLGWPDTGAGAPERGGEGLGSW